MEKQISAFDVNLYCPGNKCNITINVVQDPDFEDCCHVEFSFGDCINGATSASIRLFGVEMENVVEAFSQFSLKFAQESKAIDDLRKRLVGH
jgi:hypothetical protein